MSAPSEEQICDAIRALMKEQAAHDKLMQEQASAAERVKERQKTLGEMMAKAGLCWLGDWKLVPREEAK